jgi:hypothetical protein
VRRAVPLLLAAALATGLALRCASGPNATEPEVHVTHDRGAVRNCVDLARVATDLEGDAAEKDLKAKTADLGGNVLLVYNERSGGAFYCATPPVEITIPAPVANTTPRRPY